MKASIKDTSILTLSSFTLSKYKYNINKMKIYAIKQIVSKKSATTKITTMSNCYAYPELQDRISESVRYVNYKI